MTGSATSPSRASRPAICSGSRRSLTALIASIGGATAIEWLRARKHTAGDQALALVFYTGIAGGVVLISMAGALNVNLFGFLFGSILTTTRTDLALVAALGFGGLATIALLLPRARRRRARRGGRACLRRSGRAS